MLTIIIIILLVWLVHQFEKPFAFASVFALLVAVFGLIDGAPLFVVLVDAVIALAYFSFFFYLLVRFSDTVFTWYLIMLGGILLWLGLPLLWGNLFST